jgi:hypothetical protein
MPRASRGAGLVLAALASWAGAGCAGLESFKLNYFQGGGGQERVIVGSVNEVASQASGRMRELGVTTTTQPDAAGARIVCRGPQGEKFTLVLTSDSSRAAPGQQTRVRVEWDGAANNELGSQLLAALDVQTR